MRTTTLALAGLAIAAAPLSAAVIATDNFDYADGPVVDQTGGTGWNNEFVNEIGAPPQSPSDWDNLWGNPGVVSNALVTNGAAAKREFGGPTEGVNEPGNERKGAFRGSGSVFFSVSYRVDSLVGPESYGWAGLSSYDFGNERLFWGVPGQKSQTRYFGIQGSSVGTALSTIPVAANTTYNLVAMLDFDNDLAALWVDPDCTDTVDTYDVARSYADNSWSTEVRLASEAGTNVTWDNLGVSTTFAEAVPEPVATLLAGLGLLGLVRRRRA